ncbi:MAG: spore cortex biosynthesis protein YabQ [Clostridia bacterium]|nr:spore cortex biosynthesis protein YabQ [Clostridia bacterium]
MIDLTQTQLLMLLLYAFLTGAALGVLYDCIRALKMFFFVSYSRTEMPPLSRMRRAIAYAVTFLTDLIFWIAAGLASVILLYSVDGIFRGMIYPIIAIGFLAYYLTLGRLVLRLSERLVALVKALLKKLFFILLLPLRAICRAIISLYHLTIGKILGKIKEKIKTAREKRAELAAQTVQAEDSACGKDDLVYVDGKTGYKREGRISFGSHRDGYL